MKITTSTRQEKDWLIKQSQSETMVMLICHNQMKSEMIMRCFSDQQSADRFITNLTTQQPK